MVGWVREYKAWLVWVGLVWFGLVGWVRLGWVRLS